MSDESQKKGYPFEVVLADGPDHPSVVLADQVKSLDWKVRKAVKKGTASSDVIAETPFLSRTRHSAVHRIDCRRVASIRREAIIGVMWQFSRQVKEPSDASSPMTLYFIAGSYDARNAESAEAPAFVERVAGAVIEITAHNQ